MSDRLGVNVALTRAALERCDLMGLAFVDLEVGMSESEMRG